MKNPVLTYVLLSVTLFGHSYGLTDAEMLESRRNEAAQVELWAAKLTDCRDKPAETRMKELSLGLRNIGYRTSRPGHSSDVSSLFLKLQQEVLSIPGHAGFYARPIWESYRAYRDPSHPKHSGSATWFGSEAQYGLETLQHLPSPETVKALGEMLKEEWQQVLPPHSTVHNVPGALGKNAMRTLLELPLRDMPTPHYDRDMAKEQLSAWQQWYAEVKSGQRTFSFKGQAVEYRFKPDGTWDTIPIANPPDDAPEVQEARPADRRPVARDTKEQPPGNADKTFLPYILAALAALLALAAAWFGMTRMKPRA